MSGVGSGSGLAGSGSGSGSAAPAPVYRTAASKPPVDPALVGSGKSFMVVSEGVDATQVGKAILARGGNAVDAAVAVAFALAVVHPTAGNLGGGGFAVVRLAPGKFTTLDFRETAPAKASPTMYVDASGNVSKDSLIGHRASGVPGAVAGLFALHAKHGKLPWKELVAPAIALARDGFVLDAIQATAIEALADRLGKFPASAAVWLPGGKPARAGDKIVLSDLAATLERIALGGADGFYKGKTAALVVAEMTRGHGLITAADLAGYRVEWRAPLQFAYRGHAIVSMPPPSSGGIVLAMTANILARVELGKLPWHGVEHVHWLVEAWRRGFAARNELLGDPKFVDNPTAKLVSPAYADTLAATITERATPSKDMPSLLEGTHTTNFVVVDGAGMAVALTTTLNTSFGSCVTVGGAGFFLNNEMDDFAAKPGSPNVFGLVQGKANQIEPGKRMLSSMAPTIVEDARHELVLVLGARGGPRIITAVWQALSNVIDFGMTADAAVASPRVHFQHLPDVVRYERETIDAATEAELMKRGYTGGWGEVPREFASTTLIVRTPTGWSGAADHRGGGAAMGD
ncbi:MAG: gamma-glutamyltransferase [Proteobacteria bacterium]|nr:gamma-glutamyltransferase [Pseudomonadota bacterium]